MTRLLFPRSLPAALLLVGSYLYRLPPLLNARSTNSDAAVVGLQASHMLRGELSPFLWGSGYQTSADAAVAAVVFLVLGRTPFALMVSALTLHVIATGLVFATLRRRFEPWTALLLVMPLVVSPSSVHTYALYPPRQLSLTLALAAFWAIDGAREPLTSSEMRGRLWLGAGGLLATLAVSADPYPLLLFPLAALFALLTARGEVLHRGIAFASGAMLGIIPFVLLHQLPRGSSGQMSFTLDALDHHARLLWNECLPWALSYKVYYAYHVMDYRPWEAPVLFTAIGVIGAILVFGIVVFAIGSIRRSSLPWSVRSLGLVGGLTFPLALGAFLVSVMAMDHFSMRYLAVLTLMLPFAAAPLAHALGRRRIALVLAPHLVASAIAGWVGYGPFVHGIAPVREAPELKDDYLLFEALRERGIEYATADYWASYRLTLLADESVIVIPKNEGEDRYPPYRRALEQASVYAYVFDPGRSREDLAGVEPSFAAAGQRVVERFRAGGLTVFVVRR